MPVSFFSKEEKKSLPILSFKNMLPETNTFILGLIVIFLMNRYWILNMETEIEKLSWAVTVPIRDAQNIR